jgi:hypothetical protein
MRAKREMRLETFTRREFDVIYRYFLIYNLLPAKGSRWAERSEAT